jgi:hypothetical protein
MSDINPGDVIRVRTNDPNVAGSGFKNMAGALDDPTTVNLKWRVHGGATTTWTRPAAGPDSQIVRDSVGVYHADIPVVSVGLHHYRWEGVGAVDAAEEGTFSVTSMFVAGMP